MSNDPAVAVQTALYEAIVAAVAPVKVYDHVPEKAPYPYVALDGQDNRPRDRLAERQDEIFLYLSIWSRDRGSKRVLEIIAAIREAIHLQRFPLEVGRMVRATVTRSRNNRDADGVTYTGTMTIRVLAEQ